MKLTNKHFQLFRKECERNLEYLGLKNWKVYYQFKPLKDSFGRSQWKYSGMVATITLAMEFPKPFDDLEQQIKETALHECLEILLAPLTSLAQDRTWDSLVFDKEVHTVIRILEKLLTSTNLKTGG